MRRPRSADLMIQLILAGLCLAPLAGSFGGPGSFREVYGEAPGEGAGSGAARRAILFDALGRSALIGAGAAALALALGVPAAWALSRRRRSFLFIALCALPLALAPSVAVSGWLHWLAPPQVASRFQAPAAVLSGPGPLFSIPGVIFVLGLGLWPIVAFEAWPAFARARGEAYAAARLSGSPARAFFHVALPMVRGELAAGALLVFLLAAGDFTVSSLLLVRTLPIEVHDRLAFGRGGSAAWAALPLLALALGAALLMARVRRYAWNGGEHKEPAAAARAGPHPAWWCDGCLVLGLAAGFGIPLAGCAAGAFSGEMPLARAFASGAPALFVSLRLALAAAIFALLLGALRVVLWPESSAAPLRGSGLLLLAVPGSFLASGLLAAHLTWLYWWTHLGGTSAGWSELVPASVLLTSGYVLRFLYLPLRLTEEGLRGLDPAMLEAARLTGQSRFSRGLGIALPLLWRHLLAAAALVFVLVLGELPVSDKLAPPGAVPVSVWLFQQQHYGYSEAVFALSLLLGGAAVCCLLGTGLVMKLWDALRRRGAGRRPAAMAGTGGAA